MDRAWSRRGVPYRICLVSLIVGFLPFLVGFGTPEWLSFKHKDENGTETMGSFGLWQVCVEDEGCLNNPLVGNEVVDDWFISVVIFQSLAMPLYIVSLLIAVLQNFSRRRWLRTVHPPYFRSVLHKDSETPEDLAFIAGFLGFLGIIVFMIMTSEDVSHGAYYSWGFAMSFTGASIPVLTGVLMSKAHSPAFTPPQPRREPQVVHTLAPPGGGQAAAAAAAAALTTTESSRRGAESSTRRR